MLIRINCPNPQCKKQLRIDARHAGKKIACQGCKQHIRLPTAEELKIPVAAAAAASGEAGGEEQIIDFDMLASEAAQGDKAANVTELQTTMVEFTCPQCDEPVKVAAEHAGKRHPCPSCKRIIAIPKLDLGKPKDWREREAQGPSLAKKEVVKLEGAWGNQEAARVSLEAMEEAKALPKVSKKLTGRDYARYGVMAVMLIAVLGVSWWGWKKFSRSNLESSTLAGARQALQNAATPADVAAVLRKGMGEWLLQTGATPDVQRDGIAELRKAISSASDPSWAWVTALDTASVIGQYVSLDPKQEKPIVDLPFLVDLLKTVKDEPREAVIRQLCRSVLAQAAGNAEKIALAQQLLTTVIKQASPPSNITAQAPTKTPGKTTPMNMMDYSDQMNGLGILAQELVNAGAKENALRLIGPTPQSGERAMYKPGMPVPKAFVAAMAMVTQVDWEVGKEAEGDLDLGKMIGLYRSNQDGPAAELFKKRKEAGLAEVNLLPYLDTAEHAIDAKRLPEALSRLSEAMQIAQIYTTRRDADWKNRVYAHVRLCELTARAGEATLAEERIGQLKLDEVPGAGQLARAMVARSRTVKAGEGETLVKGLPANSAALALAGYDLARTQGELEKSVQPAVVSAIADGPARQAAALGGLVGWNKGQPR